MNRELASDRQSRQPAGLYLSTFSITARCQRTGMFGVAVSTAIPAVGGLCPFARSAIGAVATQAMVNPYLGIDTLQLLADGQAPAAALAQVLAADPLREIRQIAVVGRDDAPVAHTGAGCVPWCGHQLGQDYAVAGNMLVGPETIAAMAGRFEATADVDLPERLLAALEAAQAAGGDKRGRQSAALFVVSTEAYGYCDLRVDEHPDPVQELRRVFEVARRQLLPFIHMLPTRHNPRGASDEVTSTLLMQEPTVR